MVYIRVADIARQIIRENIIDVEVVYMDILRGTKKRENGWSWANENVDNKRQLVFGE